MLAPYRRIQTTNQDLNLIQDQIASMFNKLAKNPMVDGVPLLRVPLVQGSNIIAHTLGRNFISWAQIRPSAANMAYDAPSPDPSKYINVIAVGPCTADIYVF
jgi:hypothetical protein